MHKTRTDLKFLHDMRNWTVTRLKCYLMMKHFCCPLVLPTRTLRFGERSPTRRTTKSTFVNNQRNLIGSECDISFYTQSCIMDLSTHFSTRRADILFFSRSHLYLDLSVCSKTLAHDLKFWQIERDNDPLIWLTLASSLLIYGMLFLHRLSFVRFGFLFSIFSNEGQAHCLIRSSFFLLSLGFHPEG